MNAKLLLVPVDFSPTGEAALDAALTLARGAGGRLLVVYAREPHTLVDGRDYLYAVPDLNDDEMIIKLRSLVPGNAGVPCDVRLLHGAPVDAIVATAETEHVDMIVIGTHGRRGVGRVLMGSVAEGVMRRAKCPVLAVKVHTPLAVPTA